jgi:uncharacterized protein (TIGR02001 family)
LIAGGLLAASGAASAGVTATVTATSDYDFRGNSQSATDPALQASVDYAADSGMYLGAWVSNIDFGGKDAGFKDDNIELDLYGGFTKSYESGFSWVAHAVYYSYPGTEYGSRGNSVNYMEVAFGGGYKNLSGKIWYSPDYGGLANKSAYYAEVNYNQPLPWELTLGLHAGWSDGEYWDDLEYCDGGEGGSGKCSGSASYADYAVGLTRSFGHFSVNLKYVYPDVKTGNFGFQIKDDVFNNEDRVILTVATTFPWSKE